MSPRAGKTSLRPTSAAVHPIGVVTRRTGLSPDLLRAWEKRYDVVKPARSGGGRRLYSDADIERLRLLYRATLAGRGIGQVATLSTPALAALVRRAGDGGVPRGRYPRHRAPRCPRARGGSAPRRRRPARRHTPRRPRRTAARAHRHAVARGD